ncbi:hypothetical protein DJ43_1454 [Bacillus anthracis]|nr:hypothetical protein DJ43_1454 [Bacillus anthracis]
MITKSFYFTHSTGDCIKIFEIPVLQAQHPLSFLIQSRLQLFIAKIQKQKHPRFSYSFREYLQNCLKWNDYLNVYKTNTLEKMHDIECGQGQELCLFHFRYKNIINLIKFRSKLLKAMGILV